MARTCKICKTKFDPKYNSIQSVCSPKCAIEYSKKLKDKAWKKERVQRKKELMTLTDWVLIAQTHFNTYIRTRDKGKNCISCNKPLPEHFDAGHYISAGGHWFIRFNEDNVHGQHSRPCNKDLHGDQVNYRIGLVKRIGVDKVEELERIKDNTANFTIQEIQDLITHYKQKVKELKGE